MNGKGGSRRLPKSLPAQRASEQSRFGRGRDAPQAAAYRAALDRLGELELALDVLAELEPRGEHLASAAWLAAERLQRHHLGPHRHLVDEWRIAA